MNIQDCHRPPKPAPSDPPGKNGSNPYGDGDVPEIDTTIPYSDASDHIPVELPSRSRIQ